MSREAQIIHLNEEDQGSDSWGFGECHTKRIPTLNSRVVLYT